MNAYVCPYLRMFDGYWKCQHRSDAMDILRSGYLDPGIGPNDWPRHVVCPKDAKKQENGFPLCFKSEVGE